MQQMNPEEINTRQQHFYDGYAGSTAYEDMTASPFGQNLGDDASFADLLARRVREELQRELPSATGPTYGQRLALAIVSVVMLAISFIALASALSSSSISPGGTIALGWGIVAICVAMTVINSLFNKRESSQTNEQRKGSTNTEKK